MTQSLTITAQPNPTVQYFTLLLKSSNNNTATVRISDALGRLIETKANIAANSTLQIGHNYPKGLYFIEVVQGNEKTVLKLIRQ